MKPRVDRRWQWIDQRTIRAIHDEQLAAHGGARGLRDAALLESALARPLQLNAYGQPDLADLAASYGYGLARHPPFVDGNKRTAFVAVELCLILNGHSLEAEDADCVITMLSFASGDIDEATFAHWIRQRTVKT